MKFKLSHVPLRSATGAFLINSGLTKVKAHDEETQKHIHGMAAEAYPQFQTVPAGPFTKVLGAGEVVLGAALLSPMVSPAVAGLGLAAFSTGLLGMYWRLPGMHRPGSPVPTQDGIPLAKDIWMLAIAAGLIVDGITGGARRAVHLD